MSEDNYDARTGRYTSVPDSSKERPDAWQCTTPTCPGDPAYASPGRGHLAVCPYPKPYDGPPLDLEFTEHEGMTAAFAPFMTLIYLFGAAANGATRDEKRALHEARQMLKDKKPLAEVAQAILDLKGPEWAPDAETMAAIEAINRKD